MWLVRRPMMTYFGSGMGKRQGVSGALPSSLTRVLKAIGSETPARAGLPVWMLVGIAVVGLGAGL